MRGKTPVVILVVACLVIVVAVLLIKSRQEKVPPWKTEMQDISAAMREHAEKLGDYPAGDSKAVQRALTGENAKQLALYKPREGGTNENGMLLDPWNSPYVIEMFDRTNYIIRSSGPDGKLGDDDDYTYDSLRNVFNKD